MNKSAPSYPYKTQEIRSFPDCVMDFLMSGATTASEIANRFQCPISDIEETLFLLIDSGLVEQCGEVERGNKQTAALYGMVRTKRKSA